LCDIEQFNVRESADILFERTYRLGMTPVEQELMATLCDRIAAETDPHKFTLLIDQLNKLLESKETRLYSNNFDQRASYVPR
jgi:hypothetical protein